MPSLRSTLAYILLPTCISAASLDCKHIRVDGQSFNLEKLGGPKTVHDVQWEAPSIQNTTFTIDICNPLKRDSDVKKSEDCPTGTRVCAKEWDSKPDSDAPPYLKEVVTIAGEFSASHGRSRALDPKYTRLKDSAGNSEEKEGVVVELHGGKYPDTREGVPQKAVVEFLCDRDWKGTEGFGDEGKMMSYAAMSKRKEDDDEDDDEPKLPDLDKGKALQFVRYEMDTDNAIKVLRLRWKTKYACEGASSEPDKGDDSGDGDSKPDKSKGWGFFTWLIIVLFLLAATYIIFGSWLNYNRYGARGWDLIPHGDTIRDIPYIVKDWGTGMADRLRGDNRGGYSAV